MRPAFQCFQMLQALSHCSSAWNILFSIVQVLLNLKMPLFRRSFPDCPHPSQSTWHFWLLIDQNTMWLFNISIPLDGKTQEAGMCQFCWSVTELSSSSGAYVTLHICSVSRLPTGPYISWRAHILWKSPLVAEITSMYWHAISPHQLCLLWRWIPDELQLV